MQAAERTWHFPTDILPILTKAGCNAGKCHGAATGQGGFKLSLFGDDPVADHAVITRERGGRRIDFSNPERSLVLRKPSRDLDHKGGQKLRNGSEAWQEVRDWIASGAPFGEVGLHVTGLVVSPAELSHSSQLNVKAHFSDG
ncbi:uncharacterized protein METZ01_LOCUS459557, partial [marine metagenome]